MQSTTHQQRQPTRQDSCPACPRHRQYQCRIYICSQRHFLLAGQLFPSTRLPPSASFHPRSLTRETGFSALDALVRWLDNAESSYVDTRSHGNNECLLELTARLLLKNGLVRHPTGQMLGKWKTRSFQKLTRSIQNPPLLSIVSKNSLYSLLLKKSNLAISKLLQK